MPAIAAGSKVLVSGANGYIATWVIRTLLEHGYAVRGTVRTESKGAFLVDMFKCYVDKLELVVVEDIAKGAFDQAVKGVDAIIHTASPSGAHFNGNDPTGMYSYIVAAREPNDDGELLEPALNGTIGILKSAKDIRTVKRIIYLSSTAAMIRFDSKPQIFDENDWNDEIINRAGGRDISPPLVYMLSKVQAEKATWSFYREHAGDVSWDLTVLNPPWVFGPCLNPFSSPSELGWSAKAWYDRVVAPQDAGVEYDLVIDTSNSWADVRDVALALTKTLSVSEAGGERIIISNGGFSWQEWQDVANSLSPSPIPSHGPGTANALPVGKPGAKTGPPYMMMFDTSKEKKILGLKWRTKEELARDTLADFESRGW